MNAIVRVPGVGRKGLLGVGLGLTFLMSSSAPAEAQTLFRTIDGSANNLQKFRWGKAEILLRRVTTNEYGDGISTPAGATRPSAREISNLICKQLADMPNDASASDFVWQWGQFLDHDIDLTEGADPAESFNIPVPAGDPFFDPFNTGVEEIPLDRSVWEFDASGIRQQMNVITAWIDASNVYGSDNARALELREINGSGRLKVTPHATGPLLPFNVNGLPNANGGVFDDEDMFLAGDVRANEQAGLAAMHTLFVREHNYWAGTFGTLFPFLNDQLRYQFARVIVGAEMQAITYNEFLPILLGDGALSPYIGYFPNRNPNIRNMFSTASYRFGHSMLNGQLLRYDANGIETGFGHLELKDAFFNPERITLEGGISPFLRGLAAQKAQNVDTLIIDDVRNFLFGPPGSGGFDLASLNIQRGRDHGIANYNQARMDYGLAPVASFAEITSNVSLQADLQTLYGTVDNIDPWVGGLAEDHVPGALVGELVRRVLADQFERLRDGDRFWYQNQLSPGLQSFVDQQTLSVIIKRNTDIGSEIQDNVFVVPGP